MNEFTLFKLKVRLSMPNQCCIVLPVGSIVNVSLVVGEATKPNFNLFLATNKIKFHKCRQYDNVTCVF